MGEILNNRTASALTPDKVYVSPLSEGHEMTTRVLSRLRKSGAEFSLHELKEDKDPLSADKSGSKDELERVNQGKRTLVLKPYVGRWMRACPGTSQHVCCNLWTVNPGEGCPMDCTYCYLQSYLKRNPSIKLFTNTYDMRKELELKFLGEPERLFRVGTGEIVDSLVYDLLTDLSCELVPFFAGHPNAVLELKTKTNTVHNILDMQNVHRGRTVVSWSINAKSITEKDEKFTASLSERFEAAGKVHEAGYRVGFHFDPLIYFKGWQDEYLDTIKELLSSVPLKSIAWISLSTLRYKPEMQEIMMNRFPDSNIPFGEQFLARDNKLRYIQPLRFKMLRFIWNELKAHSVSLPVYMCMESAAAWRGISGGPPAAGEEIREVFARNHGQRFSRRKLKVVN